MLSKIVGLGLFMLYLCNLYLIFSLILIVIYNVIKTDALVFVHFLEYDLLLLDDNVDEENE